jgi:hypothetical protein
MRAMHLVVSILIFLGCCDSRADGSPSHSCARHRTAAGGISIEETTLRSVPALLRIPADILQPPILLWHGFGPPASSADLMSALPLNAVPSVKVYLGLPLFGSRSAVSR